MIFKPKYTVEERMVLHGIIVEMLNEYSLVTQEVLKRLISVQKIESGLEYYPIHNLILFNLGALTTKSGMEKFESLQQGASSEDRSLLHLYRTKDRISMAVGHDYVEYMKKEFRYILRNTYKVPRSMINEWMEKYDYLWLLPDLAQAWTKIARIV